MHLAHDPCDRADRATDFDVAPGIVYATAASDDGSMLFIGGVFNTVGPPTPHAAMMNFTSERPSLAFPRPNGIVYAVEEDGAGAGSLPVSLRAWIPCSVHALRTLMHPARLHPGHLG
ncbi:MAG: hypothetical protein IPH60_15250 [Flavobacteriales bacterium]|nr:hypothetical protein [Flavobacteriales bacterium]